MAGGDGFLIFWGLATIAIVLVFLFAVWVGLKLFAGATVIPGRSGETQNEADARATRGMWRVLVPLATVTGLLSFVFIAWHPPGQ